MEGLSEELDKNDDMDLSSLIRDGIDYRKTISVTLPDGQVGAAMVRPLSSKEWNTCLNKYIKVKGSLELYVCQKGLLTLKEEVFPEELLSKLPAGTITDIFNEIKEITGIRRDEKEEEKLTRQLLDF